MLWSFILLLALVAGRAWHQFVIDPFVPLSYRPDVLRVTTVAAAVAFFFFLDRLIRHHYWHGYLKQRRNREAPAVIKDIITVMLLLLGLATGLWWQGALTFPVFLTGIVATSGAVAFVASNALQPVILDLFSGVTINFDRSYALGDWLTIYSQDPPRTLFGCVTAITWRTTCLRLEDGTRLVVPNRLITLNPVVNHSRPPHTVQLSVDVSVDMRIPAGRVMDMLLGECFKAVRKAGLANFPEPIVALNGLSAGAAVYQITFHANPVSIAPSEARSIVLQALQSVILQNHLPLPVAQVELKEPPNLEFDLGEREILEALSRVQLFRDALDPDQAQDLAKQCKPAGVPKDELLMQQGAHASSVFIILEGAACVWIAGHSGAKRDIAVLAAGDIVGEMSLLTGAPRNASVTALTRVRVLEITKDAMAGLVGKSPEILKRFSSILASRQQELDELSRQDSRKPETEGDLLARMMSFFSHAFGSSGQ